MKLVDELHAMADKVRRVLGGHHADVIEGVADAATHLPEPTPEPQEVEETPTEQSAGPEAEVGSTESEMELKEGWPFRSPTKAGSTPKDLGSPKKEVL